MAPRLAPIFRRPALLAPSIELVGTSRSSVRIARPTTMTDDDNVCAFGLKEMGEQWTESGEGLPRRLHPANSVRPHRRGFVGVHVLFDEFPPRRYNFLIIFQIRLTSRYLSLLKYAGAKQQISANILAI